MKQGDRIQHADLRAETELEVCLRRYSNDSLIAWHLGIPKEQVTAARAKYKPARMRGGWISGGEVGTEEYDRRKADAVTSNRDFMAAIRRAGLNG